MILQGKKLCMCTRTTNHHLGVKTHTPAVSPREADVTLTVLLRKLRCLAQGFCQNANEVLYDLAYEKCPRLLPKQVNFRSVRKQQSRTKSISDSHF